MKTIKHFLGAMVLFASLAAGAAADVQSATVQYGQGSSTTFFKPAERKISTDKARPTVRWRQQSVPNGLSITYAVREEPRLEIAPVK